MLWKNDRGLVYTSTLGLSFDVFCKIGRGCDSFFFRKGLRAFNYLAGESRKVFGASLANSSADLIWIRKSLEIQAPEHGRKASSLSLGSCSDLDKPDKFCRTRKSL